MLNVVMLSVITLNVVMLNVIMLNVVAPKITIFSLRKKESEQNKPKTLFVIKRSLFSVYFLPAIHLEDILNCNLRHITVVN
jgi:hypothetical protein